MRLDEDEIRVRITQEHMNFFAHGIREPCVAALKKAGRTDTILFLW